MGFNIFKNTVLLFVLILVSCGSKSQKDSALIKHNESSEQNHENVSVGANQTSEYLPLLNGKSVGIVANQTSVIFTNEIASMSQDQPGNEGYTHLVDSLVNLNVNVTKVFAPEHGFRGTADAGEHVADGIDIKTGLPIISLYGKNRKPSKEVLEGIDIMVFDIQDVGIRFYTYIYTMHYIMEACAELNIPVIVLDRPNPNGHYVDGPILEEAFSSFIGMHPTPIVYGMTIGEYAQMINGEGWLDNAIKCELTVISLKNYTHNTTYHLPIRPSPNLPNSKSINLYPSVCLFEGTNVSEGRGTETQFQVFGSPFLDQQQYTYTFTPQPSFGSKYPKHDGILCYGLDLTQIDDLKTLNLNWIIDAYNNTSNQDEFFIPFFSKLAGTDKLQQQIETGFTQGEIKASWKAGLDNFMTTRAKYLIYD